MVSLLLLEKLVSFFFCLKTQVWREERTSYRHLIDGMALFFVVAMQPFFERRPSFLLIQSPVLKKWIVREARLMSPPSSLHKGLSWNISLRRKSWAFLRVESIGLSVWLRLWIILPNEEPLANVSTRNKT